MRELIVFLVLAMSLGITTLADKLYKKGFGSVRNASAINDESRQNGETWSAPLSEIEFPQSRTSRGRANTWLGGNSAEWHELPPGGATPPARHFTSMASYEGGVLLFGGTTDPTAPYATNSALGDTWRYENNQWSNPILNPHPSNRGFLAMAFDADREAVVLFGGAAGSPPQGVDLADTWEWNGVNGWTTRPPGPTPPTARADHAMAYHGADQSVVMFSGSCGSCGGSPTSEWRGQLQPPRWFNLSIAGPSPRELHAMAYDSNRQRIVLFGGSSGSGETWEYDGTSWLNRTPSPLPASWPSGRFGHAMAFDQDRGITVLFGGSSGGGETWEWDGTSWIQPPSAMMMHPTARRFHAMAYDPVGRQIILFGGSSGNSLSSATTWAYFPDCNGNGVSDGYDIDSGSSEDGDKDRIPDECQEGSASACCFPLDTCEDLTEADCTDAGGLWQPEQLCGDGAQDCPPGACIGSVNDCYTPNELVAGCQSIGCCELVCNQNALCCSSGWDKNCVELALALCGCPNRNPATPTSYTITKIADIDDIAGAAQFGTPSINEYGDIASILRFSGSEWSIILGDGVMRCTAATTTAGLGPYDSFGFDVAINSAGNNLMERQVAFWSQLDSNVIGIYRSSCNSNSCTITDSNAGFCRGTKFNPISSSPSIADDGSVLFNCQVAGFGGLAIGKCGQTPCSISTSAGPVSFNNMLHSINGSGRAAFRGVYTQSGITGIFAGDCSSICPVADDNGPLSTFGIPVAISSDGEVAFTAVRDTDGASGIFRGTCSGPLVTVVDDSDPLGGNFTGFSLNASGLVVFTAAIDTGGSGIFNGPDPNINRVIGVGDMLFGREISSVALGRRSLNDAGQIAFLATFTNGPFSGVYRADPVVEPCPVGPVTFIDPPSSVVDARQPHPVDNLVPAQGISSLRVTAPVGANDSCWTLCETARLGAPNSITSVTDDCEGTYTITLTRPITPGAVTQVTYTPSDGSAATTGTFIAHPANVNGDGAAAPVDIIRIIDCLNGVPTCDCQESGCIRCCPHGLYSRDIDHSGTFAPQDILRVIDLLNGADLFEPWNNTALPAGNCTP